MGGGTAITPKVSLPKLEAIYSNQVDYTWNENSTIEKEIIILNEKQNVLLKAKKDLLDNENKISSLRFYTPKADDFIALGFDSSYVSLKQKRLDGDNKDELLEEALLEFDDNNVYTSEDF